MRLFRLLSGGKHFVQANRFLHSPLRCNGRFENPRSMSLKRAWNLKNLRIEQIPIMEEAGSQVRRQWGAPLGPKKPPSTPCLFVSFILPTTTSACLSPSIQMPLESG